MAPTQHFGDLKVAFAEFLLVWRGNASWSKATPGVHCGNHPLSVQMQANQQVENANYQHGEKEEGQRRNQDDQLVDPVRLDRH